MVTRLGQPIGQVPHTLITFSAHAWSSIVAKPLHAPSPHATMAPSAPADFVSVIDDVPLIDVAGAGVRPRHLCNTARIPTRCVQGRNLHPAQALAR